MNLKISIIKFKHLAVLTFLLLSAEFVFAQEILVAVDTNWALIGQPIQMGLEIKADKETTIQWPLIGDTINGLEVLGKSRVDTFHTRSEIVYRQKFALTTFDTGVYKIDSLVLKFQRGSLVDSIISYPVYLAYNTVKLDSTNRYFDIKQPMDIKYNYWFEILMGILAFLVVAALIWFLYKRRKPKEEKKIAKVLIPAHITALKKLQEMQQGKVWLEMVVKNYYVVLTDILRQYINDQHHINAVESTSDEIMDGVAILNLKEETKNELKDLLQMSDLVKFAKIHPLPEEGEKYLAIVIKFVNETKPNAIDSPTENNKNDA